MKTSRRWLRSDKTSTNETLNNGINKSIRKTGATTENKKVATKTVRSTSRKSHSTKTKETKDKEIKENMSRIKRETTIGKRSTRRTVLSSKKKVNILEGTKLKNKTSFRQMSLKESFSHQETLSKRLRPRKESRNYCEDSVLQQKNTKSVNEPIKGENPKVPVYKSIKLTEESLRNESDIYDFKFDTNDSEEKLVAKRKGRIINRVRQKRVKKTTRAKPKQIPPTVENKSSSVKPLENIVKKPEDDKRHVLWSSPDIVKISADKINKKNVLLPCNVIIKKLDNNNKKEQVPLPSTDINSTEIESKDVPSSTDTNNIRIVSNNVQNLETNHPASIKVISENMEKQPNTVSKPRIVSIETLDKNKVLIDTPVKSNLEYFAPFRKTNIFNNKVSSQYGIMNNDSLINKSLSPIKKASENFDPGSPWRLTPLNTFSQVKNLYQSTPQPRNVRTLQGRIKRTTKEQVKNLLETVRKSDILETDNENVSVHKTLDKSNYTTRKLGQSIRKFGTEITNLDHSVQPTNNTTVTEQYEGMASNRELRLPGINVQNMIDTMPIDSPAYNDTRENKENAAPTGSKSKKLSRKRSRKINNTSSSPLQKEKCIRDKENLNVQSELVNVQTLSPRSPHSREEKEELSKENFDPQPGPSGLQKYKSSSDKPLQQTNLNAFLNITEMPQSTRIITAHGIFGDAHSTPICGKPVKLMKQVDTKHMELDNAFGFEEDSNNSNLDISPIYPCSENNDVQNKNVWKTDAPETRTNSTLPVRLLPQEIKKDVLQENVDIRENNTKNVVQESVNIRENNVNNVDKENLEVEKPLPVEKNKVTNPISFSDTFDVQEKDNETKEESSCVLLFADLEPTHFKQPPKRLYKRKRNVRFNFSESGNEDNGESDNDEPEKKKKKHGKLKKEDVQRMRQWIKSINDTFQEIDHHELVVE